VLLPLRRLRRQTQQAWEEVEVLLTRRYDSAAILCDALKHQDILPAPILNDLEEARLIAMLGKSPGERSAAERHLSKAVTRTLSFAGALSIAASFHLDQELLSLPAKISFAGDYYNSCATRYNRAIARSRWVQGFGHKPLEIFSLNLEVPKVYGSLWI
jgi:LemA protein